jgi:hypothetical protein
MGAMSSAALELRVAKALSHARLLEHALYDHGPWSALIYGCCQHQMRLTRTLCPDEGMLTLTGYLEAPCSGIQLAEVYCGSELATVVPVPGLPAAPFRMLLELGVAQDDQLAA